MSLTTRWVIYPCVTMNMDEDRSPDPDDPGDESTLQGRERLCYHVGQHEPEQGWSRMIRLMTLPRKLTGYNQCDSVSVNCAALVTLPYATAAFIAAYEYAMLEHRSAPYYGDTTPGCVLVNLK